MTCSSGAAVGGRAASGSRGPRWSQAVLQAAVAAVGARAAAGGRVKTAVAGVAELIRRPHGPRRTFTIPIPIPIQKFSLILGIEQLPFLLLVLLHFCTHIGRQLPPAMHSTSAV